MYVNESRGDYHSMRIQLSTSADGNLANIFNAIANDSDVRFIWVRTRTVYQQTTPDNQIQFGFHSPLSVLTLRIPL
jgi:hypothetical protein